MQFRVSVFSLYSLVSTHIFRKQRFVRVLQMGTVPCSLTVTNSLKGRGDLSLPEELKNPVILSCHLRPIPLLLTRDLGSFANVTAPCRSFAAAAIAGNHLSFSVEQTELHLMSLVSSLQPSVPISFLFVPLFYSTLTVLTLSLLWDLF